VDGSPAIGPSPDPTSDPVAVLRDALATAVDRLDDQAPGAMFAAYRIGAALADAVSAVHAVFAGLVAAQPAGAVALTLKYVRNAVAHLEAGEVTAGRAAVLTAHVTLARLAATTAAESLAPDWSL
jgi:hypothetical protein